MYLIPNLKVGIWNAWILMSVFLLQMSVMMFYNKCIWEKSRASIDASRSKLKRNIGIVCNLIWLLAMIYSIFLPLQLGTIRFYIGLSLFFMGLILLTVATYNFINTPADMLITKGLYHFSRHPMYLATFFICLGSGVATSSWIFIFLTLILVFCFNKEAIIEERYCLEKYDNVYEEYLNSVPRWIGIHKINI